jgi:transcriptional regulator with XRE-family HTH domain
MPKTAKTTRSPDTVDAAKVEASIRAKNIGKKIRRLRLKRSMGLVELGQLVGLSASFLSQLETGRVVPTMRNLASIAIAFKKDFTYFLAEEDTEVLFRVSRADDRIRLEHGQKETFMVADSLSILLQDRKTVPCVAELLPGDDEEAAFNPPLFPGLELVYVIAGPLVLATDNETAILEAEDSAWIDGNTRRRYKCYGESPARALIMTFAL